MKISVVVAVYNPGKHLRAPVDSFLRQTMPADEKVAEGNGADVVAAREIGHGFGVPRRMFRRTIADAKLGRDDLLALLTPQKLFRRSMLVEHDIHFPEGPRRLEDHHFVIQAYFHARRITVTGGRPFYFSLGQTRRGHERDRHAVRAQAVLRQPA